MSAESRFNNDLRYRASGHERQRHLTPGHVLDLVRRDLGDRIDLDPCTEPDNPTGAKNYYTVDDDGLTLPWDGRSIFVNPPYGKVREPWVERCIEAGLRGQRVVLLIPAATDTRIFQRAVLSAKSIVFVRGRLKFGTLRPNRRQNASSHPSALIGWNTALTWCATLGFRVEAPPESCPDGNTACDGSGLLHGEWCTVHADLCPRCDERPATTNYGRWCPGCRAEVEGVADALAAEVGDSVHAHAAAD